MADLTDSAVRVLAAASLVAARLSAGARVRLGRALTVHSLVDEGEGCPGALRRWHGGASCTILEPTSLAVMTARCRALTSWLTLTGLAAHGAVLDAGVSAVEVFSEMHAGVRESGASRPHDVDGFLGTRLLYGISMSIGTV